MKVTLIFIFFCCLSRAVYAGDSQRIGTTISPPTLQACLSRPGASNWASGGASIAEPGISAAASINPALMEKGRQVYLELGKSFETEYGLGINWDGQFLLPAYASYKSYYKTWNFEIGYINLYDCYLFYLPIEFTTVTMPAGTGEFFDGESRSTVHCGFFSFNHMVNENLTLAATLGLTYLYRYERIDKTEFTADDYGFLINSGILFEVTETTNLALNIKFMSDITGEVNTEGPPRFNPADTSHITSVSSAYTYKSKFPLQIGAGVFMAVHEMYSLMAALKYFHWKSISGEYDNIFQLHLGSKIKIRKSAVLRLGLFTLQDPVSKSLFPRFNETFLTVGIDKRISANLFLCLSWQDTHIWDPAKLKQLWNSEKDGYYPSSLSLALRYVF